MASAGYKVYAVEPTKCTYERVNYEFPNISY